ncbi:MAG TPA: cupin domain-containing protein [Pirellulales bacterium]|nr:cupin domain-containing protein [Pirellulales bacterium]
MAEHAAPRIEAQNARSRREFVGLAAASLAGAAIAGYGQPSRGAETESQGRPVASDLGPQSKSLDARNPDSYVPPASDHGEVQSFWNSFSVSHRRIQTGGWTRQVNVNDFPIAKEMAGVNMRLTAGGIRELHWHSAAEWALMLSGNARLTTFDFEHRPFVGDVAEGDLWYFPAGQPHSIQGLGPDGCEFLLVFDDGKFSEGDTTLLTDWALHTPREVLGKDWSVSQAALSGISGLPPEGKYIFQGKIPGTLADDKKAAAHSRKLSPEAFTFRLQNTLPAKKTGSGEVRIADSTNFTIATNIAVAWVKVKPGGLRELHWHPNSDEWQYYLQGKGRMTVFFNAGKARTADFGPSDVGYVPRTLGHYIENTGTTDLIFLELFKAQRYQDFSLSDWITHTPPELILDHLPIDQKTLDGIPRSDFAVVPP